MKEVWDKNGNVYFVDDNGEKINNSLSNFEKAIRKGKAAIANIDDWLNATNLNSDAYKQKVGVISGLTTAPFGLGTVLTGGIAKGLTPVVGRKIAQTMAQGFGGGLVGGAVEGGADSALNGKNIVKGALKGAAIGAPAGLVGGYAIGKIGQGAARTGLKNGTTNKEQYFNDYVADLNNKTKAMADFRLAQTGGNKGASYKLLDQDSWHGTPFKGDIDKFNLDFMGSGEGAQMYGAGVYTAKGKDIANKHYRFIGEDIEPIKYKGKPLMSLYNELERQANRLHPREAQQYYDKMSLLEDLDYKGGLDNLDYFNPEVQNWYKNEIEPNLTMPGRLYRVQVPDNDVLLHSDLPLNQQPVKVQKSLRDMFFDQGIDIDDASNIYDMGPLNQQPYSEVSGQTLYNIMNGLIDGNSTNRKATSQLFDRYGIKGIRAFGDRDGEIFVTFNPDNAKIVESYYPNKLYDTLTNPRRPLKNPKLSDKINYIDMMDDVEKARITSEFNTNLSKSQLKRKNIRKAVGNYYYTAKNNGFNNYEFTGRYLIDDLYR